MAGLLIVAATGPNDPTRASIPFHIAVNGAVPSGTEVAIALAGDAAELARPDIVDAVVGVGIPRLRELVDKCVAHAVRVYVWKGCAEARGVSGDMLGPKASFITPPDLVRLTMEADRVLSF